MQAVFRATNKEDSDYGLHLGTIPVIHLVKPVNPAESSVRLVILLAVKELFSLIICNKVIPIITDFFYLFN